MKEKLETPKAPKAIGPYSQAVKSGNFLYISGQTPIDLATGDLVKGDIGVQATLVMNHLTEILKNAGTDWSKVVKTTIFLTDLGDFAKVNEIYKSFLIEPYPARSTIEVSALPKGASVEIEAIAILA